MAFGKKKKKKEDKAPEELPKLTETVVADSVSNEKPPEPPQEEASPELKAMLGEFSTNYNGIVTETAIASMATSTEMAMNYNLLFAIYGELIKQRKLMEDMLKE